MKAILSALILALGALRGAVWAETNAPSAPGTGGAPEARTQSKEELLALLETRQAQLALDYAKSEMQRTEAEYEQTKRLYDGKIVTIDELKRANQAHEQAVLAYRKAQIDIEKTRLGFLKDAVLVTVLDARKYRTETGRYMVSVTIRNDSNLGKARMATEKQGQLSDEELASLLQIDNVIVTLIGRVASGGSKESPGAAVEAIVGDPYQRIVPVLRRGATEELTFQLIKKDVEALTVRMEYLGVTREYPVFLKREASEQLPTVMSSQYAQQGQLGSKIRYDLVLERLGKEEQSFSLVVINLPPQITFSFLDPQSDARVTEVRFSEDISKRGVDLELSIPEKLPQELVDSSLKFDVFVTRPSELKAINDIRQKHRNENIPAEDLATIKGSRVELILIPKGIGKLEILMSNQYKEVQEGEKAEFKFTILNSGTLDLRQITPSLDLPLDWEGKIDPVTATLIAPGQKAAFTVAVALPVNVVVGEYAVKIAAVGHSGIERVEGVEKTMTIRLVAKRNITGTMVLVTVLIVMVVVIAVATVRISRR